MPEDLEDELLDTPLDDGGDNGEALEVAQRAYEKYMQIEAQIQELAPLVRALANMQVHPDGNLHITDEDSILELPDSANPQPLIGAGGSGADFSWKVTPIDDTHIAVGVGYGNYITTLAYAGGSAAISEPSKAWMLFTFSVDGSGIPNGIASAALTILPTATTPTNSATTFYLLLAEVDFVDGAIPADGINQEARNNVQFNICGDTVSAYAAP